MGILGILRDSAGSLGDSRGFSGFLEKVYEVSEVSNPSEFGTKDIHFRLFLLARLFSTNV